MDIAGKTVIVVGLGRSGRAAAALAKARGAHVLATDAQDAAAFGSSLDALEVELWLGGFEQVPWEQADLVVISPGVAAFPALSRASRVVGELEFASWFAGFPLLAIGGTNGKSTTTLLVASLLQSAGLRVFAGGNLGVPLSEAIGTAYDVAVVEVSSFQLERVEGFHPKVSVLLNISDDHLDRYPDLDGYAFAKGNAFINQVSSDTAVVPVGDARCLQQAARGGARIITFGPGGDFVPTPDEIVDVATGRRLGLSGVNLHGSHNRSNVAAAVAAVAAWGIPFDGMAEALRRFEPLPHRMAWVRELDGVTYFDDSKATNVGAAVTAVLGLSQRLCVLIAGGRDKQGSYEPLAEALAARGRAVVLLGEAAPLIEAALGDKLPVHRVSDMASAIHCAEKLAKPGDAVLLSPACSSFDMYPGYAARGDHFSEIVRGLVSRGERP